MPLITSSIISRLANLTFALPIGQMDSPFSVVGINSCLFKEFTLDITYGLIADYAIILFSIRAYAISDNVCAVFGRIKVELPRGITCE